MSAPRHLRNSILSLVVDILSRKTNGYYMTAARDRVYKQRFVPLSDDGSINTAYLPAIAVYVNDEKREQFDWTQDKRTMPIFVECFVAGPNAFDDIDEFSEQIEILLRRDQTLEESLSEWRFNGMEWLYDKSSDGEIQGARLKYEAEYLKDTTSTLPLHDLRQLQITETVGDVQSSQTVETNQ